MIFSSGYFFSSAAHCEGVKGTRLSGGFLVSLMIPMFIIIRFGSKLELNIDKTFSLIRTLFHGKSDQSFPLHDVICLHHGF